MKKMLALIGLALSLSCQSTYDKSEVSIASAEEVVYYLQVPEARSRESVVSIDVLTSTSAIGSGSGAYVRYKGRDFVFTAAHVVENAVITLVTSRGHVEEAKILLIDRSRDFAVLQVPKLDMVKPIRLSAPSLRNLSIGDELVYTGFPNRFGPLTIRGNVSAFYGPEVIIMQSYAWSGASGSLVLDRQGDVVGVLTAIELLHAGKDELINNPNIVYVNVIDKQFLEVLDDLFGI
jgi:S1-C subfamily serine protease